MFKSTHYEKQKKKTHKSNNNLHDFNTNWSNKHIFVSKFFRLSREKSVNRASINFQTQEVPDFLPLKFESPTGKSRKSHSFPCCGGVAVVCPFLGRT